MPRIAVYLMAASRMIRWFRLHELMTWIHECDAKRLGTSFKAALRGEQFTSGDRDNDQYAYRPEHVINRCNPYLLLTFWGELQGCTDITRDQNKFINTNYDQSPRAGGHNVN